MLEGSSAVQTRDQYVGADGKYTPERLAIHAAILEKTFTPEAIKGATPVPGEDPTFAYIGGRPGSGKNWFTESPNSPIDTSKYIVIGADVYKAALPEYTGWNSAVVHEESTDIALSAHLMSQKLGVNVLFDATMRTSGTVDRLSKQYAGLGYKIDGYYMHTAPQVAATRALKRFLSAGRYLPPEVTLGSDANEKVFDAAAKSMRSWVVYDNNASGPVKVAEGGN